MVSKSDASQPVQRWNTYADAVQVGDVSARGTPEALTHLPLLLIGLEWLYGTEQPAQAIAHPDGEYLPSGAHRVLQFIPGSTGYGVIRFSATPESVVGPAPRPISRDELTALVTLFDDMNEVIVTTSLALDGSAAHLLLARPIHRSLLAAVKRYHAERRIHRRCNSRDCTTMSGGRRRLIGVGQLLVRARARRVPVFTPDAERRDVERPAPEPNSGAQPGPLRHSPSQTWIA